LQGLVRGAFRFGLEAVCFTGSAKIATKLADIAGQKGRTLLRRRPAEPLDLRDCEAPLEACRAWFADRR